MNNPYPKQPSGSYRSILVKALLQAGKPILAEAFDKGELKLAIKHTITGAVTVHPEINQHSIDALSGLQGDPQADYYQWGLQHGQLVVASSKGAFVYDLDDEAAKDYFQQKMKEQPGVVSYFS